MAHLRFYRLPRILRDLTRAFATREPLISELINKIWNGTPLMPAKMAQRFLAYARHPAGRDAVPSLPAAGARKNIALLFASCYSLPGLNRAVLQVIHSGSEKRSHGQY